MVVCNENDEGVQSEAQVGLCSALYEHSKHIFSEVKLRGLVPNFYIHVYM
jgi:hypothetical protein